MSEKRKSPKHPQPADETSENQQSSPAIDEHEIDETHLVSHIKSSAKEIWLAGLGAFSQKNEKNNSVFQQLVIEGRDLEKISRTHIDRQIQQVRDAAMGSVGNVKERAAGSFNRLESIFDERVSKALKRLGLFTQNDQQTLEKQIAALEARIQKLEKK